MDVIEEINEQEVYNYSKIIRPTSMRSTYWKFFGFPADDSGSIITRRSVICSICGLALSYNKNTSNLKSHLRTKHPEQMNFTYNPPTKKTKFIYTPPNDIVINSDLKQVYNVKQATGDMIANPDDLIEILAEDVDGEDYQDVNDEYQIEYLTAEDASNFDEEQSVLKAAVSNIATSTNNVKPLKRKNSETLNIESSLISMIVDDLLPITMSEGTGFISFITSLCGSRVQIPNGKTIEKQIQRLYQADYERLSQSIKTEMDDKFFSIGFEKWINKEESTFITTHVNYLTDDEHLNTVVLNVVDSSYASDWKQTFSTLTMGNCVAAIADFDITEEESLKVFLDNLCKNFSTFSLIEARYQTLFPIFLNFFSRRTRNWLDG